MAWLNFSFRRTTVSFVLLVLCVVDVSLALTVSTSDYTTTEQASTLAFLRGLAAANPVLARVWHGTDFCAWPYMSCDAAYGGVLNFRKAGDPFITVSLSLPELGDDVDGSSVIVGYVEASSPDEHPPIFAGTLPSSWGSLTQLVSLDFYGSNMTGTLPSAWKGMSSLSYLDLRNNSIEDTLPPAWSEMVRLKHLSLKHNKLTGTLPASWAAMVLLESLELEHNSLTGTLPSEWSQMENIMKFSLHANKLTGTLPASWSLLPNLSFFWASDNAFTGSIPSAWVDLPYVYQIHVTNNQLCGCVPDAWHDNETVEVSVDPIVSAADCAVLNGCGTATMTTTTTTTTTTTAPDSTTATTTTPTMTTSTTMMCSVVGCETCADGSPRVCLVCRDGYVMEVNNVTCRSVSNGVVAWPSTNLTAVLMAAVTAAVITASVMAMLV